IVDDAAWQQDQRAMQRAVAEAGANPKCLFVVRTPDRRLVVEAPTEDVKWQVLVIIAYELQRLVPSYLVPGVPVVCSKSDCKEEQQAAQAVNVMRAITHEGPLKRLLLERASSTSLVQTSSLDKIRDEIAGKGGDEKHKDVETIGAILDLIAGALPSLMSAAKRQDLIQLFTKAHNDLKQTDGGATAVIEALQAEIKSECTKISSALQEIKGQILAPLMQSNGLVLTAHCYDAGGSTTTTATTTTTTNNKATKIALKLDRALPMWPSVAKTRPEHVKEQLRGALVWVDVDVDGDTKELVWPSPDSRPALPDGVTHYYVLQPTRELDAAVCGCGADVRLEKAVYSVPLGVVEGCLAVKFARTYE
ncbi:MAG TPA: hypothetical protein VHA37_03715, partial [Candidatus Saccharimonadales bacterium]|nr:hypothetical protein [Candidatus Saccharimonadales bacterium]